MLIVTRSDKKEFIARQILAIFLKYDFFGGHDNYKQIFH